jgi:PKD repeat protein
MRRRAVPQVELLEHRWMPNAAPIVQIMGQQTYNMGDNALFSASATDPDGQDPSTLTYYWDFNYDGQNFNPMAGGNQAPYLFPAPGNYDVAVQVSDNDGDVTIAELPVTVNDIPPTADAGPSQVTHVGTPVTFQGNGAYEGDPGSQLTFEWDFNYDGQTFHADANGQTVTNTYTQAGTYTAALRVTDEFGGTALSETTVTVLPGQTDIALNSVTTPAGDTHVQLAYHIDAAAPLTTDLAVTLYATQTGVIDAGATALGTTTIHTTDLDLAGNPALAPGDHTVTRSTSDLGFPADRWCSQLAWQDYYLVARINSDNAIAEANKANNDAVFSGVYRVAGSEHVFVQGTDQADLVTVSRHRHTLTVTFDGQAFTYNTRSVDAVLIRLHGGDDVLQGAKSPVPLIAWAGPGNDYLEGGRRPSVFFAGSGNDTLIGHSLLDLLFSGSGNDTIVHQPVRGAFSDWWADLWWVVRVELSLWHDGLLSW